MAPDLLPFREIGYTAEECERDMRRMTNGERGCANPDEHDDLGLVAHMAPEGVHDYKPLAYEWENDPKFKREWARYKRRIKVADSLTKWMRHIPIVGRLVYIFWSTLIEEGPKETLKPRWGALTFFFLNDGMKPTLWHTWRSIVDPMEGIWVGRAPRNAADAKRMEQEARSK
jgi:hypothetical protein